MRQDAALDQREHRMRLCECMHDGKLRGLARHPLCQARDQIRRQERRIARRGRDIGSRRPGHPGVQPGERPREAADFVGHHRVAERRVAIEILIGVDDERSHLRRESLEDVRDHRPPVQRNQSLVDATHAPPHAAGEDEPGDGARRNRHGALRSAGSQSTCSS
jgi:hypothetical protein